MSNMIHEINKIKTENIKIGKTFKYGDNYNLTNIYYIENNTTNNIINEDDTKKQCCSIDDKSILLIQTPLMYIPNSIIYFNDKPFLELSFNNEGNDKDVLRFKEWVYMLEDYVYNLIKKRSHLNITKDNLTSIIKKGYNNKSSKLLVPININISKCIVVDDYKRNKILFKWDIPVPTYAISIIWVKNIWINKGKWGINLFMYSTSAMNSHILDPSNFMNHDINNKTVQIIDVINKFHKDEKMSILICNVPEYETFYRMLKMGIPKNAIKQKMQILNINTNIIDYPANTPYASVLHCISNSISPNNISSNNSSSSQNTHTHTHSNINLSIIKNSNDNDTDNDNNETDTDTNNKNSNNTNNTHLLQNAIHNVKLKKLDTIIHTNKNTNKNTNIHTHPSGLKVPSLMDIQGALNKLKKVNIDIIEL